MSDEHKCELCGEPMPKGEEMFKYHGYSGPCPKQPIVGPKVTKKRTYTQADLDAAVAKKISECAFDELAAVALALEPVRALLGRFKALTDYYEKLRLEPNTDPHVTISLGVVVDNLRHLIREFEAALASAPSLDAIRHQAVNDFLLVVTGHSAGSNSVKDWMAKHDERIREQARAEGALEEARWWAEKYAHGGIGPYRHMDGQAKNRLLTAEQALERAKGASQ